MARCDIVIPVWNQRDVTRTCIDSLKANTDYPYRIIIVDNASDRSTSDYLAGLAEAGGLDVMLIRNAVNEGFIKAVNKGIAAGSSEYVCILNNDTVLTAGWLGEMVRVLESDPKIGIVNPSSNTLGQRLPKQMTPAAFARTLINDKGRHSDLGAALGFCMLARRRLFEEIGLFDEIFGMGNFEDTDFAYRALTKGYRSVRSLAAYVFHQESKSFGLLKTFNRDFEANRAIFEKRWGRPRRFFLALTRTSSLDEKIVRIIEDCRGANNWVSIARPNVCSVAYNYSRVTCYVFPHFFTLRAVIKVIFKKKKFDVIICDDRFTVGILRCIRLFHGAEVSLIDGKKSA
ncbi:MAG: glycosyltransferase family 2 protein [Candidatus Omnitrophica bacterium]|nr:glycosyltransferase family 2 protein [Candidatus Omnitrophota bacterium]